MTVAPVPVLAIAGVDVAAGPGLDGTWPTLMALAGANVRWGREEVTAHPTPATATVSVFDTTGTWAAGTELVGAPITLRWTWAGTTRVYFRGRVSSVELERLDEVRDPDGNRVRGAQVTLACSSVLVDLGNRRIAARPAETVAARRAALAAVVAGPVSSITTPAAWDTAALAAVTAETKALDALAQLFDDCGGTRYGFDPDTQAVAALTRRAFTDPAALAFLTTDPSRVGAFISAPGGWIDGGVVSGDRRASKDMDSRLTRAELTYSEAGTATTLTRLVAGTDEATVGVRALSLTTRLTSATVAGTAADGLAAVAAAEASGWRLEPMRWDTRRTGGFETVAQAQLLLSGAESAGVHFLAGTWVPDLGIRPVFGVQGGTITYTRGAWSVQWRPAPIGVSGATPPPLAWEDLDPDLTWDAGPTGMHPSVTYEDLRYVASGLIVSTP